MVETIGIDLDGVVFNVINPWLSNYNLRYDDDLKMTDLQSPAIKNHVKPECDVKWLYGPDCITNDIMLNCEFFPGAKEFLIRLMDDPDYKVIFITNTFPFNRAARGVRISEEFFGKDWELCFIADKWRVKVNIFIDDFYEKVWSYKKFNPTSKVFLISRPWNAKDKWDKKLDELKDLEKFL